MSQVDISVVAVIEDICFFNKAVNSLFLYAPVIGCLCLGPYRVLYDNTGVFICTGDYPGGYVARASNVSGILVSIRGPLEDLCKNMQYNRPHHLLNKIQQLRSMPYESLTDDEKAILDEADCYILYYLTPDGMMQVIVPARESNTAVSKCAVRNARLNNGYLMRYLYSGAYMVVALDDDGNIEIATDDNVYRTDISKSYTARTHVCNFETYSKYFDDLLGSHHVEHIYVGDEDGDSFKVYLYAVSADGKGECSSAVLQITIHSRSYIAHDFRILPQFNGIEHIDGAAFLKLRKYFEFNRSDELFGEDTRIVSVLYDYDKVLVTADKDGVRRSHIMDIVPDVSQLSRRASFEVKDDFILSKTIQLDGGSHLLFDLLSEPVDDVSYCILDSGYNVVHTSRVALSGDLRFTLFVTDRYDGSSVSALSVAMNESIVSVGSTKTDFSDSDMRLSVDAEGSDFDDDDDDGYYTDLSDGVSDSGVNTAAMVY